MMCKELTVISILLMALVIDGLRFWQVPLSLSSHYLLAAIAIFLTIFMALTGKRFLERLGRSRKSSRSSILKPGRLGFQPGLWKHQRL